MTSIRSKIFVNNTKAADLSKSNQLLHSIPEEIINMFANSANIKFYQKGQSIYFEEEDAEFFYFIKSGLVKLFHQTMDGDESIIDILTHKHVFGEDAIFNNDTYENSSEAVEDTELLIIPTSVLKEQINSNPKVALAMLSSMSKRRKMQEREIEHLTIQNAPQRVGCFLLRLCPKNKDKNIVINLPYDKTLIAARLRMKPETFSRSINTLRQVTKIRIRGSRVEIDNIQQLSDFSCGTCSSTYPYKD